MVNRASANKAQDNMKGKEISNSFKRDNFYLEDIKSHQNILPHPHPLHLADPTHYLGFS